MRRGVFSISIAPSGADFLTHQRIRRDVMKLARASDATTNFLRSLTSRELIELAERKPEPKINMTEMARAVRAGQ
jgi:hypothetical protein